MISKYETNIKPHLKKIGGWKKQGVSDEEIAKRLKIAYSTFRNYRDKNEALSSVLKNGLDEMVIFAESKLYKEIEAGNLTAIIFYLKSKGGYLEEHQRQNLNLRREEIKLKEKEVEVITKIVEHEEYTEAVKSALQCLK